jgi:hypothetical protein
MPRVDDYFPFHCGDLVRELDGRHVGEVRAVVSNLVLVDWLDTGWRGEYYANEIEHNHRQGPFLATKV